MFISYCIPHFNNSILIKRCIDSIIKSIDSSESSESSEFEIVITDDCSSEEQYLALQILLKQYNNINIRLFRNFCNRGVTFTKNKCYLNAIGKWCVFIDCDDYFDTVELNKMKLFLINCPYNIILFHCLNDNSTKNKEKLNRLLTLDNYASCGTGGEALTVINKKNIIRRPYYGALRGYEGLGLIRLMKIMEEDLYLSNIKPRVYTSDSAIRLSVGKGFSERLDKLIIGHKHLLINYFNNVRIERKLKLIVLIVYYSALRKIM